MRLLRCLRHWADPPRNDVLYDFVVCTRLILCLFVFIVLSPTNTFAQTVNPAPAYAVIINQIRGESCCSPGNLENTRTQLENAVTYELPTTFVLRYDALIDPRYTELILSYQQLHPDLIQTGVMVEIIPALIQSTNVQFSISKTKCDESREDPSKRDPAVGGMTGEDGMGLEGQRAISAAEMSEESVLPFDSAQGKLAPTFAKATVGKQDDKVTDEFLREEIGCCPEGKNNTLQERDPAVGGMTEKSGSPIQSGMTDRCKQIHYKGSAETWFQAQNAFTIGYTRNARIFILDTLLAQYQKVFGTYPTVSSAWMIDTDSVNYLHDKYGVTVQQITREQWGTDSYTLYGGPPHYPYPASRNWIMNPDFDNAQAVTIVRQTVTDPLYNYGDTSSSYTSQPNDYMRGGRTIEYFKTLIDNAIHQQSTGFANIGLENSMEGQYQEEYARQLEYIAKLRYENKLAVVFPDVVGPIFQSQKITTYARTDGDRQAIWITTPQYRARIIRNNNEVAITDLRLYSKDLKDPYSTRVAKHEGYWVVPFLIDGSRWYAWRDMDKYPHKFIPVMIDFFVDSSRMVIAKNIINLSIQNIPQISNLKNEILNQVQDDTSGLSAIQNDSKNEIPNQVQDDTTSHFVRLSVTRANQAMSTSAPDTYSFIAYFYADRMILPNEAQYISQVPSQFPVRKASDGSLLWTVNDKLAWSMKQNTPNNEIWRDYTFSIDAEKFSQAIDEQYPYVYPESVGRNLSDVYTRVSVNNTFALAGRNPVRLVLEPHDAMNFPIILDREAEITVDPDDTAVTRLGKLVSSQQQYVDLDRSDPRIVGVTVNMNQRGKEFTSNNTVYFAPNCKNDWGYCVVHPVQGVWYVLTKITDWWSGRK